MRRDELRLRDILENVTSVQVAIADKDRPTFDTAPILQNAIRYCLLVIGEAASHISKELQAKYPLVKWTTLKGLRNVLAHQYFGVDLDIIWQTASQDLPPLRAQIAEILASEFPSDPRP